MSDRHNLSRTNTIEYHSGYSTLDVETVINVTKPFKSVTKRINFQ